MPAISAAFASIFFGEPGQKRGDGRCGRGPQFLPRADRRGQCGIDVRPVADRILEGNGFPGRRVLAVKRLGRRGRAPLPVDQNWLHRHVWPPLLQGDIVVDGTCRNKGRQKPKLRMKCRFSGEARIGHDQPAGCRMWNACRVLCFPLGTMVAA
jgi:hypothetical protein